MSSSASCTWVLGVAAILSGCVGATTQLAPLPPGAVEAEKERQRQLALLQIEGQQARLDSVAYPILAGATDLCPSALGPRFGLRISTIQNYPAEYRAAARAALGLGDTLSVLSVERGSPAEKAGLLPKDRVLRIGHRDIRSGSIGLRDAADALDEVKEAGLSDTPVTYKRGDRIVETRMAANRACNYGTLVLDGDELNAYADGSNILITSTMMRFAGDEELAVIVAHEFAHNAMDHIGAKKKNSLFGALLGAIGDIVLASQGINTGAYYTTEGAKSGARAFSQDFEREADYVGLYALALSGHSLEGAPRFWRHMATANPKSIGLAFTHPTTAERFVRMEQAIAEIEQKRSSGLALSPNKKGSLQNASRDVSPMALASRGQLARSPEPALASTMRPEGGRSELRSISESRLQYVLQDLTTRGILSSYEEASPGILVLVLGTAFESIPSVESGLKRLYSAYTMHAQPETPALLELWLRGEKIGEYGATGLAFDPADTADQPVREYQPGSSPESNDIPDGTNWVTDRRSGTYFAVACTVVRQIPDQDRLYYANESAPRGAGFVRGKEC